MRSGYLSVLSPPPSLTISSLLASPSLYKEQVANLFPLFSISVPDQDNLTDIYRAPNVPRAAGAAEGALTLQELAVQGHRHSCIPRQIVVYDNSYTIVITCCQ